MAPDAQDTQQSRAKAASKAQEGLHNEFVTLTRAQKAALTRKANAEKDRQHRMDGVEGKWQRVIYFCLGALLCFHQRAPTCKDCGTSQCRYGPINPIDKYSDTCHQSGIKLNHENGSYLRLKTRARPKYSAMTVSIARIPIFSDSHSHTACSNKERFWKIQTRHSEQ
jgi:hypothetical protein